MKNNKFGNIVVNIPHSSINGIFDTKYGKWCYNQYFMNKCVKKWTDWYTDFLFYGLSRLENVDTVVFPYSRFVCDVERLENDEKDKIGQGIIYTQFEKFKRGELSDDKKQFLLDLWQEHRDNLKNFLNERSLLVDCHSFPSTLYDTDICIGYNDDWSYDENIVNGIKNIFESRDYTVTVNKPYSNSITPETDFKYKSVMIEVNKRVYMNESLLTLEQDGMKWARWNGTLEMIYNHIFSIK